MKTQIAVIRFLFTSPITASDETIDKKKIAFIDKMEDYHKYLISVKSFDMLWNSDGVVWNSDIP